MAEVFFNGPAGRIEGKYTESNDKKAPLALVLHPHPLYEGTMNNTVVYKLYQTLASHGFTVLRINFRGVGRSQGNFDNGVGEMTDAATALDWLQLNNPLGTANLISGFSFGAWIAMQLIMRRPEINNFIAVSPPVNKYDFSFLSPCPIPGLIVQGDQDSIVSESAVIELVNRLSKQKHTKVDYQLVQGADHFFRGKIDRLTDAVSEYLSKKLNYPKLTSGEEVQDTSIFETKPQKVFLD
jgi:hypothetical protein